MYLSVHVSLHRPVYMSIHAFIGEVPRDVLAWREALAMAPESSEMERNLAAKGAVPSDELRHALLSPLLLLLPDDASIFDWLSANAADLATALAAVQPAAADALNEPTRSILTLAAAVSRHDVAAEAQVWPARLARWSVGVVGFIVV